MSEHPVHDAADKVYNAIEDLKAAIDSVPLYSLTVSDLANISSAAYKMRALMIILERDIPWKPNA